MGASAPPKPAGRATPRAAEEASRPFGDHQARGDLFGAVPSLPAISMWQPFASLMFTWDRDRGEFVKAYETRKFKLPLHLINQPVAIHATAKFPADKFISPELHELCLDLFGCSYNFSLPFGAIIGIARFGPPVPTGESRAFQCPDEIAAGDWAPGRWAWPVMSAEALPAPVPVKGKQGWWRVDPAILQAKAA